MIGYDVGVEKRLILIKSQLSIRIFLRCRTDGWHVVTKGKTRLRVLLFCKRADCLVSKLISDSVLCIRFYGIRAYEGAI